jgi:hypothetical protein
MKIGLLLTLAGLVIGFSTPVPAQEQNAVDPEVRQQIETVMMKFDEAFTKGDATAIAALFTQDAIEAFGWEKSLNAAFGRRAVERRYVLPIPAKLSNTLVQVYPIGDEICAISEFNDEHLKRKGHAVLIYVHEGDTWKIRMKYAN